MTGFEVREKLVSLAVGILQRVAEGSGSGVKVEQWDGENELKRPWCDVQIPMFESYGAGSDAWECRLAVRLVTKKGESVPKGEFAKYIKAIKADLGGAAEMEGIGISDNMDVEDVESGVDSLGRVVGVEFVFAVAI